MGGINGSFPLHGQLKEMVGSSEPDSTGKLRLQPHYPKASDFGDSLMDSCSSLAPKTGSTQGPTGWKQRMKMKMPCGMSSPPYRSSSTNLGEPSNHRISLTLDKAIEYELEHGRRLDPNTDRKKLRRTISNRLSAQRSRLKKAHYIDDMEKMVDDLEKLISVLTPQIESYKEKRKMLLLQNDSLQKSIEIRLNESKIREVELEQKRIELDTLKELEKTVKKNSHDSDSEPEQTEDASFQPLATQPYLSLGFYQNGLQKFESNQFWQQQLPNFEAVLSRPKMPPNLGLEQPGKNQLPGIKIKQMGAPEKNQEETEVDQYLNFEALNVDISNVWN